MSLDVVMVQYQMQRDEEHVHVMEVSVTGMTQYLKHIVNIKLYALIALPTIPSTSSILSKLEKRHTLQKIKRELLEYLQL